MRRTILLLTLILSAPTWALNGNMGNGTGSQTNPYRIQDFADFQEFAGNSAYWAAGIHTRLETDIDLDPNLPGRQTYTTAVIAPDIPDTSIWTFNGTPFSGIFDGNTFAIFNLTIDTAETGNDYLGLFGNISGTAVIKNLGIEDVCITGTDDSMYVGGLVGINQGTINGSHAEGAVYGGVFVGGLVGDNYRGDITDCYAATSVSGNFFVGGLVGEDFDFSTITFCRSAGTVTGSAYVGGLAGSSCCGHIQSCCSMASVRADEMVGGLLGDSIRLGAFTTVSNCYAVGDVKGRQYVGGLVGLVRTMYIIDSYAAGQVSGELDFGGLCGSYTEGNIIHCFWDVDTSGIGSSGDDNYGATGKTTVEMMTKSIFTDAEWIFDPDDGNPADWMMLREGEDYPRLAWQTIYPGDIAGLYGVDMVDAANLSRYWQVDCPTDPNDCGRADIDISGHVGLGDLTELINDWLKN